MDKKSNKSDNKARASTIAKKKAMLAALLKHKSIVTSAAKQAGIDNSTHYAWLKDDADYAAKVDDIQKSSVDYVVNKLLDRIEGVVLPDDKVLVIKGKVVVKKMKKVMEPCAKSIMFYLETKGKEQGWQKRTEISGPNGGAIEMLPSITIGGPPKKEDI